MNSILIKSATIVNENKQFVADILVKDGFIERIDKQIDIKADREINAEGLYLFPGCIDDQVHFREPGLTHKATIYTESRAAVAGGITSFMEMPNTVPNALTQQLLEDKYQIGAKTSLANYSFYMGASNDNLDEVLRTDTENVCGIKVFMGSSTGNMLVDNPNTLENIFAQSPMLVATHCEDEATIQSNLAHYKQLLGENITVKFHPKIRSEEACYLSSSMAVDLAKRHGTRLHILHISTEKETYLFDNSIPLKDKKITAEACIHHLWFTDKDYETKGNLIKWNPAVKTEKDRDGILKARPQDDRDRDNQARRRHRPAQIADGAALAPRCRAAAGFWLASNGRGRREQSAPARVAATLGRAARALGFARRVGAAVGSARHGSPLSSRSAALRQRGAN